MRQTFKHTWKPGFYIEWEEPRGQLWSMFVSGEATLHGIRTYDFYDQRAFNRGWEVTESEMTLEGDIEVTAPTEEVNTFTPETLPDVWRDYLEDEMIHLLEKEWN